MRFRSLAVALAALLLLSSSGCGYHFGTTVRSASVRGLRLAVPVFYNDTFEPVLDKRVTEFVRREFLQADGVALVNDPVGASTVLRGRVRGYYLQTLSFRGGVVNEQRVTVVVDVKYEDPLAARVLWQESYSASAEFFQTTDLAVNRARQDRATEEACQVLAEHIASRVLEGYDSVGSR